MDHPAGVGTVARLLGVSIRTLHHWHHTGVAVPSGRTSGGYRTYSEADIARLQRVLLFRELGVPLRRIPPLLEAGALERRKQLGRRREDLTAKIVHLQRIDQEVERLLAAEEVGILLPVTEQREIFGEQWDPAWTAKAREQWGDSAQWSEYAGRSSARSTEDWRELSSALSELTDRLARAKHLGLTPGSDQANALAERHRETMSRFFHCTHAMHVILACGYVTDSGYHDYYERSEPGLAAWLKQIIDANARAHGVDPHTAQWQ